MGAQGSALLGKAIPCDENLLPYTEWQFKDVENMRSRHTQDLGSSFALTPRQFEVLLDIRRTFSKDDLSTVVKKSSKLFSLFDSDGNRLVDCYEVMAAMAMIAHTSIKQKIDFVHSLYDFNGTGEITFDELVLLLRTVALGCQKIDPSIEVPGTTEFESLATVAFTSLGRDLEKEIAKFELDDFCMAEPRVREFLDFFSGTLNEVPLARGELFCDPDFPPDSSSLFDRYDHTPVGMTPASAVTWLRPAEVTRSSPVLLAPSFSDGYLVPGQLSDLYFLKALGMLLVQPQLVRRLFLQTRQESHGRYCVQFFKEGNWTPVYIDDRVPCNLLGRPIYSSFSDVNDVWVVLVEKAYAKLHGCYEGLSTPAGCVADALRDLTGGPCERLSLRDNEYRVRFESGDLWNDVQQWASKGLVGLMATDKTRSMPTRQGIILNDTYSVLQTLERRGLRLIQLKNVFGRGRIQGTPWDPDADVWTSYPDVFEELKLDRLPDHVFWIEYSSLLGIFDMVTVCWLLRQPTWKIARRFSSWVEQGGGCFNHATWPQTQQVFLKVTEGCNVVVNLTQMDPRYHRSQQQALTAIGLAIVQHDYDEAAVHAGLTKANLKRWRKVQLKVMTPTLQRQRDVFVRVFLPKGKYAITPMTARQTARGRFWLSIYYDNGSLKISQGGQCRDERDLEELSRNVSCELEQEMMDSRSGPPVDAEDGVTLGLRSLAAVVNELWLLAKQLQQRKMVLEEALMPAPPMSESGKRAAAAGVWRATNKATTSSQRPARVPE